MAILYKSGKTRKLKDGLIKYDINLKRWLSQVIEKYRRMMMKSENYENSIPAKKLQRYWTKTKLDQKFRTLQHYWLIPMTRSTSIIYGINLGTDILRISSYTIDENNLPFFPRIPPLSDTYNHLTTIITPWRTNICEICLSTSECYCFLFLFTKHGDPIWPRSRVT